MKKVADTILDKLGAAIRNQTGTKPRTCWVAAAAPCGTVTARIIVASLVPFTAADAVSAIHDNLHNTVIPFAPSFTPLQSEAHSNLIFASVHGYRCSHHVRPADEANMAKCQAITASTYLDVEMQNVWERKEIGGKQYLMRANDDDLEEVMGIALTASVAREARVQPDGFTLTAHPGDTVLFFATEQTEDGIKPYIDVAKVTDITGSSVGITIEEGGHKASAYLPAASIVNIIEAAALDGNTSREDILEFLAECYGPEYAKALKSLK